MLGELQAIVSSDGLHEVILLAAYSHYLLGAVIHKNHLIHLLPDIFLEPAWQMAATPSVGGYLLLRAPGLQFCSDLIPLPLS